MTTETHTARQRGRRAAERATMRMVPDDLKADMKAAREWLDGFDSVPVVRPSVPIKVVQTENAKGLPLPEYATAGAAGVDLISEWRPYVISKGECICIPTGLKVAVPPGYELQIRPRSGLALKHGITVLNTPGTIDEDYRGEIGVILINHGTEPFVIERGMRIAQAVLAPVTRLHWVPVDTLDDTARGAGGFGSSGL